MRFNWTFPQSVKDDGFCITTTIVGDADFFFLTIEGEGEWMNLVDGFKPIHRNCATVGAI